MREEAIKERIESRKMFAVAGGEGDIIPVTEDNLCSKPGCFQVLENKKDEWQQKGCPQKCSYCWHLKLANGFYCDA